MRVVLDNLKIELENQEEIRDFWNVIMFALDLHAERQKEGKSCMCDSELKLAKELERITNKSWE